VAVQLVVIGAPVSVLSCHCACGVREFFESGLHPLDKAMEVPLEDERDATCTRHLIEIDG